jgi:hypothetical protein
MEVDKSISVTGLANVSWNTRSREFLNKRTWRENMADEKSRDMNQQQDQGNQKAQGATASVGAQGQ